MRRRQPHSLLPPPKGHLAKYSGQETWREPSLPSVSVCDTVMLYVLLPDDKFAVVTDASIRSIGGVLQVWRDDEWHAAAFYTRQTRGPEVLYSATELEALAVAETLAHFAYYLYGRDFVVFTDHMPLCHLLTSDRLNSRLRRLALTLQHDSY